MKCLLFVIATVLTACHMKESSDSLPESAKGKDSPGSASTVVQQKTADVDADAVAVALTRDRQDNPAKHIDVHVKWRKGASGTVALVKIEINNRSLKACKNPRVTVSFLASGQVLSTETVQIFETFPAGTKRTSKEINYGAINSQVTGARAEITSATYE